MGQLWTHTLRRLGSLGPDSELEMRLPVVSWALGRFCNTEQVQDWAEGKGAEMQLEAPTNCYRAGPAFHVAPNCIPGPITIQVAPSRGGVIQGKVTPSLRAQPRRGLGCEPSAAPNLAAGEGTGAWSLKGPLRGTPKGTARYPRMRVSPLPRGRNRCPRTW